MRRKEKRKRVHLDFYETPPWATRLLIEAVRQGTDEDFEWKGDALEPCSGNGAIARVLGSSGLRVLTNDIDPRRQTDLHLDAREPELYRAAAAALYGRSALRTRLDWVVTNPPFSVAFPILRQSLAHARIGVAFLLRLSFLEPTRERGWLLDERPPDFLLVLPRISFDGDGNTDSVTYAWFVWYADPELAAELPRGIRIIPHRTATPKEQAALPLVL